MKNLLRSATLRTLSVVCAIALVVTALPVALNLTASAEDTNSEYYYYDFATSTDYDTTSSGVLRKYSGNNYVSADVSDGVLKLKNPTQNSSYGVSTWVFNSKGSKATFTPGKKYTISFRWKQAVATTQQAENTCWLVVANGTKYSGDNLAGLSDSAVMPTAGDYGWAPNDKTPNHRNYKNAENQYTNRHLLGNGKNFNNAQNWGYKTISFVAYNVTGTAGAKNELAFTACLSGNQEIHIDDIIVREEKASAPACTSETYDFNDATEYNIAGGLYYGKNDNASYGTLAINAEEGALELGCVSGKDYGAATWVVNKNGVPFTMEPGKNYKISFKYRQTVAKSANTTPWIVLTQGGVNTIVTDSKWLCDAAVMGEGSYSYPTGNGATNYRTKQQHITSFITSETYTTFSKEFVAYDVSGVSTAAKIGANYGNVYRSNTLCITFCMGKNQKVLIDEITILEYEAGMDADMSFEDYPSAWTENRGEGGFFAYRADVVAAPDDADNKVVVIDNSCTVAGKDKTPLYGNDQKQFIPLYIPGTSDVYRTDNDGRAYKINFKVYVEQSGAKYLAALVSTSNSNTTLWSGQQTYYDGKADIDLAKKGQWQDVTVYFTPVESSNVVFLGISFFDQKGQEVLSRVYIDDVSISSIESVVKSDSAASLTEDAKAQNNGKQAIRFFGTYQVNDDGKVVVDGKAYTLVERGMLLRPYSESTYEMHENTSNIVVAKTTDFSKQWKKEGNTVTFSNYLNGIGSKSYGKDVEVRAYIVLKADNGSIFTLYSDSGAASVNSLPKDQSK